MVSPVSPASKIILNFNFTRHKPWMWTIFFRAVWLLTIPTFDVYKITWGKTSSLAKFLGKYNNQWKWVKSSFAGVADIALVVERFLGEPTPQSRPGRGSRIGNRPENCSGRVRVSSALCRFLVRCALNRQHSYLYSINLWPPSTPLSAPSWSLVDIHSL